MARDNWDRQNREYYQNRRGGGSCQISPQSRRSRPPPHHDFQSSVPHWEKKFCAQVGAVPWRKLVEAKKFLHLYPDILEWKDSACEEAFRNAKQRFWAEMNGFPCNIMPADPDMYIDEINWNPKIDPALALELERELVPSDPSEHGDTTVNLESPLDTQQPIPCTGWDVDQEEPNVAANLKSVPEIINCDSHADNGEEFINCGYLRENGLQCTHKSDKWELAEQKGENGLQCGHKSDKWEPAEQKGCNVNVLGDQNGWDRDAVKNNSWDDSKDWNDRGCNNHVRDNRLCATQEGAGWSPSRYASPAYHRDSYKVYRGYEDAREGKAAAYYYGYGRELPSAERLPSYWRW